MPARLTAVFDGQSEVEVGRMVGTVGLWLTPEARIGDYVYVHADYAVSVVDEVEARRSLRLLRRLAGSYPADELFASTGDLPARKGAGSGQVNAPGE
jgi:hydrogenase expression/formation protein HypC